MKSDRRRHACIYCVREGGYVTEKMSYGFRFTIICYYTFKQFYQIIDNNSLVFIYLEADTEMCLFFI